MGSHGRSRRVPLRAERRRFDRVHGRRTGPPDLVFAHGFAGNIEIERETPFQRPFHDRAASFSRFILFDKRGTGLSDRPREPATLEARMDDVRAVMDAVGSERAVLFGTGEAGAMCALFAATYPERTLGLVLLHVNARGTWAPDYPWAPTAEEWRSEIEDTVAGWGTLERAAQTVRQVVPSEADNPEFAARWARHDRLSASPGAVATLLRMTADVDIRDVLGAIRVPTLAAHDPGMREEAEYLAARIPGARRFEVTGPDHAVYRTVDTLLPEVERFVQGLDQTETESVLATLLFTDIVGSTGGWPNSATRAGAPRRAASRTRPAAAVALPRPGGGHGGRRLLRPLRRADPRHPLRAGDRRRPSASSASRSAPACIPASASSSARRSPDGRQHRCTRVGEGRPG